MAGVSSGVSSSSSPSSSAEILSVEEVLSLNEECVGKPIRTWGRVIAHDINTRQVILKDDIKELTIDTEFLEPFPFNKGSLYNIFGDVITLAGMPVAVKGRIATCIDGLNIDLFKKALYLRRMYLKEIIM